MNFFRMVIAFIMSVIALITNPIEATIIGDIPQPLSETELEGLADFVEDKPLADEIIVIPTAGLGKDERSLLICLQGLANREKAQVFINFNTATTTAELAALESKGCELVYSDENGNPWTSAAAISYFADEIADNSYTLYTDADTHGQINIAFNMATVYGRLAVPSSCEEIVKSIGMTKAEDLTDDDITIEYERSFYHEHKDKFRKNALVHMYADAVGLRDLAIQQGFYIAFTMDSDFMDKTFRHELLTDLEPASLVIGWCQYEVSFTKNVSSYGHYVIPSDHSYNVSILGSCQVESRPLGNEPVGEIELDPTKHYVTIMYSDGDNAQWVQNGYSEFHTWRSYNIDVPLTWTFPPLMNEFSSADTKRTLDNMGLDSLICGPSGAGYARISQMSGKEVANYSDVTAAAMLDAGLTTLTLLDSVDGESEMKSFGEKIGFFSRYDNIKGGILQLDPDRYAAGGGRVFFRDDKPFISVRHTLWHPTGDPTQVTREWLDEQAAIVNGFPADNDSINGYSVINIHPWTVGPDDLAYFISQLDDDIVVISGDEMIAALTQNIPHEDAKPE